MSRIGRWAGVEAWCRRAALGAILMVEAWVAPCIAQPKTEGPAPAGRGAPGNVPGVRATGVSSAADPAALEEGQALFRGLCSGCHGGLGRGGKGPDLTDTRW